MLHDFMITEKFCIIPDMPLVLDPKDAIQNKRFLIKFDPTQIARFGFVPRNSTDPKDIIYFEFPQAFYTFHFVNSWDWINEKGEEMVTVFGAAFTKFDLDIQYQEYNVNNESAQSENDFTKYTFNMATGEITIKNKLLEGQFVHTEFPVINSWYNGYKNRYTYMSYHDEVDLDTIDEREKENKMYDGIVKYDL